MATTTAKKEKFAIPTFGFVRGMDNQQLSKVTTKAAAWLMAHLHSMVTELENYILVPLLMDIQDTQRLRVIISGPGVKIMVKLAGVGDARGDRPELNRFEFTGMMPFEYPVGMDPIIHSPKNMEDSSTFVATRYPEDLAKDIWNRFWPNYNKWLQERSEDIEAFGKRDIQVTAARIVLENTGMVEAFEPTNSPVNPVMRDDSKVMFRKLDVYQDHLVGGAKFEPEGTVKLNSSPVMPDGVSVNLNLNHIPLHLAKEVLNLLRASNWVDPFKAREANARIAGNRKIVADISGS